MADDEDVIYLPLSIPNPQDRRCGEYVREDWALDALLVPCGRAAYGKTGLCSAHYKRSRDQVPMDQPHRAYVNARRTTEEVAFRDADGKKQCSTCRQFLFESEFNPRSDASDGLSHQCQLCINLLRYGLNRSKAESLLRDQDGRCANSGCRIPIEIRTQRGEGGRNHPRLGIACVDHDHSCCPRAGSCGACIRGLLCWHCNSAAGLLGDSPNRMYGLAEYMHGASELRAV